MTLSLKFPIEKSCDDPQQLTNWPKNPSQLSVCSWQKKIHPLLEAKCAFCRYVSFFKIIPEFYRKFEVQILNKEITVQAHLRSHSWSCGSGSGCLLWLGQRRNRRVSDMLLGTWIDKLVTVLYVVTVLPSAIARMLDFLGILVLKLFSRTDFKSSQSKTTGSKLSY